MSDVIEFLIENKRKDLVKVILKEIEGRNTSVDRYYPITTPTAPYNPLQSPWYVTCGGGTQA